MLLSFRLPYCANRLVQGKSGAGSPDMLALVVGWVHTTQGQLPSLPPLHIPVQPEAENRVFDQSLVNHVVEGGDSACHLLSQEIQAPAVILTGRCL